MGDVRGDEGAGVYLNAIVINEKEFFGEEDERTYVEGGERRRGRR